MSDKPKKFKFEDLQPHVDMLCDALENKGASPSGIPYNDEIYSFAIKYREVLQKVRDRKIGMTDLWNNLLILETDCLKVIGKNQRHRISKILYALDLFIKKEYNKVKKQTEGWQSG